MTDDFLNALRQEPSPEFAQRLESRLRRLDAPAQRFSPRVARWAALAASLAIVSVAFTFPSVRAGAQAFLDLFRVSSFAGVAFDPRRFAEIAQTGLDLPSLISGEVDVDEVRFSAPVSFATPEEAGAAAGLRLYTPAWVPAGLTLTQTELIGETALKFTLSLEKLQTLLDALGIDDVRVPVGVDGQQASIRVPPIVKMSYANGPFRAILLQAKSPDVSFPAELDLPVLAEAALRILGLDRQEAYRVAQSVDWRTTLLVPVPVTAATFRDVNVQGQSGLLIESIPPPGQARPVEHTLLWSFQGNVYALSGTLRPQELLEMAQTLQ
jgi:hypothetical protein